MKKLMITGLFICVLGLASVSADTWQEYMQRANTMTKRLGEFVKKSNLNSWSIDQWVY